MKTWLHNLYAQLWARVMVRLWLWDFSPVVRYMNRIPRNAEEQEMLDRVAKEYGFERDERDYH